MGNRRRTVSINILDDDSLLHVFYLYRPLLSGEDQDDRARRNGGYEIETRGRWWYKPAQVCQRWRNIIFGSASYLGVFLVCTHGTPVADMLAHSPHFPLILLYATKRDITTDDEQGMFFALKQRDRILRVYLITQDTSLLEKFIAVMDEEFPILEYLIIGPPTKDNLDESTILTFPETFQAPHLRLLRLGAFAIPMGSQLLTTAVSLVTLYLVMEHPSTYFYPNALLQCISLMPQLETLAIYFSVPIRDVEMQLTQTPIIAPVTLPNLHYFRFRGVSTYLEALVHRITAPRLERLNIELYNQLTFSVPCLLEFMNTTGNLRFDTAVFKFVGRHVKVEVYYRGEHGYAFGIRIFCWHLDWQISSMAQISNSLSQMFSAVDHLILQHEVHGRSSEEHDEVDRTEWRRLLRPFRNVKTLRIAEGLVEDLSHCLQLEDGELPLELLPELQELAYSGRGDTEAFTSFIDTRRNAGRPVTLAHR
jgi:hypothetical protein